MLLYMISKIGVVPQYFQLNKKSSAYIKTCRLYYSS